MRLIDADLLLSCIGDRYTEKKEIVPNNLAEGFVQVEKLIKEQPTAYDVGKVVEQLEDRSTLSRPVGWPKSYEIVTLEDAIEIVRGGEIS